MVSEWQFGQLPSPQPPPTLSQREREKKGVALARELCIKTPPIGAVHSSPRLVPAPVQYRRRANVL